MERGRKHLFAKLWIISFVSARRFERISSFPLFPSAWTMLNKFFHSGLADPCRTLRISFIWLTEVVVRFFFYLILLILFFISTSVRVSEFIIIIIISLSSNLFPFMPGNLNFFRRKVPAEILERGKVTGDYFVFLSWSSQAGLHSLTKGRFLPKWILWTRPPYVVL